MLFLQLSMVNEVMIIVMKVMTIRERLMIKECFQTRLRNTTYIYPLHVAADINYFPTVIVSNVKLWLNSFELYSFWAFFFVFKYEKLK